MNIDSKQVQQTLGQVLEQVQFPVNKNTLIQAAQRFGANDQVVSMLQKLPDISFNSTQDVQNALGSLKNLGGIRR